MFCKRSNPSRSERKLKLCLLIWFRSIYSSSITLSYSMIKPMPNPIAHPMTYPMAISLAQLMAYPMQCKCHSQWQVNCKLISKTNGIANYLLKDDACRPQCPLYISVPPVPLCYQHHTVSLVAWRATLILKSFCSVCAVCTPQFRQRQYMWKTAWVLLF